MNKRIYNILLVDDEINIIRSIIRVLDCSPFHIQYTVDPLQAIDILKETSIDVIISDQRMPNMNGLELLTKARNVSPSTVRILMSAYSDIDIIIKAINDGQIFQYITKPWDNERFIETVHRAILHRSSEDEKARIIAYNLEKTESWNNIINDINSVLERKKENSINALLKILKAKDECLYTHCVSVSETTAVIAEMLHFTKEQKETARYAGLFHDIGKITIRDKIMYKAGFLEDEEFDEMKHHPAVGAEILREIDFLGTIADIVEQHHERIDGKGYPKGISEHDIMIEAKVVMIADNFEALRENRVYHTGMSKEEALLVIREGIGTRFDPEIVVILEKAIQSGLISNAGSLCEKK